MDLLVVGANVVCWGAIVLLWIALAVRSVGAHPPAPIRGPTDRGPIIIALLLVAAILVLGRPVLANVRLDAAGPRLIGALVLVASSGFAAWARLALGSSWSIGPQARPERGLRTDGPYAITRHPIYTGLLGMLLGSALLGGLGQWLVLVAAGLTVIGLKIRSEERLLMATYPDAYREYRERVPGLIPMWRGAGRMSGDS